MSRDTPCKESLTNRGHKLVAQLVSYPMGRLWARFMPSVKILGVSLNPGPFTIKEHVGTDSFHLGIFSASVKVLVTIMAGVGSESAYAVSGITSKRNLLALMVDRSAKTDIIAVQRVLYKQTWSFTCKKHLMVVALGVHRSQINGYWSCQHN